MKRLIEKGLMIDPSKRVRPSDALKLPFVDPIKGR